MSADTVEKLVWRSFLVLVILAPIPGGSIHAITQAFLLLWIFALFTLWALGGPANMSTPATGKDSRLGRILTCWTLVVGLAVFQVVPLPPHMIATLSPVLHDLYRLTLPGEGGADLWRPLSTAPGATVQSGLLIAAYGVSFLLVIRLCYTRSRAMKLALVLVLVGVGQALYGLIQAEGSTTQAATGTFVNRNHYAALLAMSLAICVGLVLFRWESAHSSPGLRFDQSSPLEWLDRGARMSPLILASLTILAGLIFAFSRMGLAAPLLAILILGTFWSLRCVSSRIRIVATAVGATSLLLVAGAWPALEVVAARFQDLESTERLTAWEGTYTLFLSSPIVGVGLGGLVDNLPRVLNEPAWGTFDHSHNEPLEILAEGGIIYGALLLAGLFTYFATLLPVWLSRRDPLARGLGLGCLAGTIAVLLHSLVEFPLRMPANAYYLCVLMALGWAVICRREPPIGVERSGMPGTIQRTRRVRRTLLASVATTGLCLSGLSSAAAVLDGAGDRSLLRAARAATADRQAFFAQAQNAYQRAQVLEPWQPVHPFKMGKAYELVAVQQTPLSPTSQQLWTSAAHSYRQAVRLHPANARLQAALAWAALQSGDVTAAGRAIDAALMLAPDDPHIHFTVAKSYLAQWESLDRHQRQFITEQLHRWAPKFPERYVDVAWHFVHDPEAIRGILPNDLRVRRVLLKRFTDEHFFLARWAEQAALPELRVPTPDSGIQVIAHGYANELHRLASESKVAGHWAGLVSGRLSAGLAAKSNIVLPRGEALLLIPILAEPAGGVWPTLSLKLDGQGFPVQTSAAPGWQTLYVLVTSRGERVPLQATVTNGTVLHKEGRFVERRASLGPVRIVTPEQLMVSALQTQS